MRNITQIDPDRSSSQRKKNPEGRRLHTETAAMDSRLLRQWSATARAKGFNPYRTRLRQFLLAQQFQIGP
jgi:hypothetical protein